jgi:tRNA-specific 2-thiouridylase
MTKEEVRGLARAHGLEVAEKPESQDFVAGGDYAPLFENEPPEPGDIVDTAGNVLGRHRGLPFYTVGQRRGIGVSAGPDPLYVLALDAKRNSVIVGPNAGLFSIGLACANFRFQDTTMAGGTIRGLAKIRQNHKPVPCAVSCRPGAEGGVAAEFDIAQRAVADSPSSSTRRTVSSSAAVPSTRRCLPTETGAPDRQAGSPQAS